MSPDENKALLREFVEEVFHKRNLAMIDHYMAVDMVEHDPLPVEATGSAGQKQFFALYASGVP
jgi:hypothetical protein